MGKLCGAALLVRARQRSGPIESMKRTTVFALDRLPGLTSPSGEQVMVARPTGRKEFYSGSSIVFTDLGLAYLPGRIGDPRAWLGAAVAGVTAGVGTLFATPVELLVSELGSSAAEAVNEQVLPQDVQRNLQHEDAFVVAGVGIVEAAVASGFFGWRLKVVEVTDQGVRVEHSVTCDGSKPGPYEVAEVVATCRARSEAIAALRTIIDAGHEIADVRAVTRRKYADAATRFAPWPEPHRVYLRTLAEPG